MTAPKRESASKRASAAKPEPEKEDGPEDETVEETHDAEEHAPAEEGAPRLETPEDPAPRPEARGSAVVGFTPASSVSTATALTDATVAPYTPRQGELDTGTASVPGTRTHAFGTPAVLKIADTTANDYGVGSTPGTRPDVFARDASFGTAVPSAGY